MKGSVLDASSKGTKAPQVQGTAKAIEVPKKETTVLFVRLPRIFFRKRSGSPGARHLAKE